MSTTELVKVERAEAPEESFELADVGHSFSISPQTPPDVVVAVLDKVALAKERVKELDKWCEAAVTEWVRCNGPLTCGDFKWYIGEVSEVEWTDIPGALDAAFVAAGGDWDAFARDFLASKPLKHGSFEKAVGAEAAAKFFRRVKVEELKDNTATVKKKLMKVDTRFVR